MRIIMNGRERTVSGMVGRTLIRLNKATAVEDEPKSGAKPRRTYRRRDLVAESPVVSSQVLESVEPDGPTETAAPEAPAADEDSD